MNNRKLYFHYLRNNKEIDNLIEILQVFHKLILEELIEWMWKRNE